MYILTALLAVVLCHKFLREFGYNLVERFFVIFFVWVTILFLRKWKIIENKIQLLAMCRNGKIIPIDIIGIAATEDGIASQGGQKYAFPHSGKIRTACKDEGPLDDNLLGFYLGAEINDEGYLTGGFCPAPRPGSSGSSRARLRWASSAAICPGAARPSRPR